MKRGLYFAVLSLLVLVSLSIVSAECNDGIDNDEDGFIDFPDDPDCDNETDVESFEAGTVFECNDGIDNDGDGFIDFPDDIDCDSSNGLETSAAVPGGCVEDWDCSSWGDCMDDGFRYRDCYDFNACGTEIDRPLEQAPCDDVDPADIGDTDTDPDFPTSGGEDSSEGMRYDLIFAWSALAVSLVVLVIMITLLLRLKPVENSTSLVDSRKKLVDQVKSQGTKQAS